MQLPMEFVPVKCQELTVSKLSGGFVFECRSAELTAVLHSLYGYIVGQNIKIGYDGSHNLKYTIFL